MTITAAPYKEQFVFIPALELLELLTEDISITFTTRAGLSCLEALSSYDLAAHVGAIQNIINHTKLYPSKLNKTVKKATVFVFIYFHWHLKNFFLLF